MSERELEELTNKLAQTKVDVINELSFKGRGLKLNKKEDAKEIVEKIEKFENMTALRLEGNTVGVEAAEAIAGALAKHPEFTRARWSDMFTGRLKTEIPAALKHLGAAIIKAGAGLVELDLSDNAFGPTGVDGLVELLKSKSSYALKELRLNNNGLGIGGGKMLAQCLLDCHKCSTDAGTPLALKTFISGRNRLENDGAQALAKAFKAIGTLEEIAMPQNGINPPGIAALAEAFENNTKLRILNLNDNTFTEKGAVTMSKVLVKLTNLEVINFGDCLLRTRGAKAIAEALATGHEKLRELILSGNEIKKDGAVAVAESTENKVHLTVLDLDGNQLGEEGIELVKGTLDTINKLDVLGSLSGDEGSDEEEEEEDEDEEEEDAAQEGSEEEEVQDDDEEEGEEINDPGFVIQGKGISPSKQDSSLRDFLSFPSPSKLQQMGKGLASKLKAEFGEDLKDVEKTLNNLVKISCIVQPADDKTKNIICECADIMLKECFQEHEEGTAGLVANACLVYLGLLKGEDKKYRPPSDISGPLLVLEHCVRQPYFPKLAKEILQMFISKPHPLLDKAAAARHKILQTLYAI